METAATFYMRQTEVTLIVAAIDPHAFLLEELEDIIVFQGELGSSDIATYNGHADIQ